MICIMKAPLGRDSSGNLPEGEPCTCAEGFILAPRVVWIPWSDWLAGGEGIKRCEACFGGSRWVASRTISWVGLCWMGGRIATPRVPATQLRKLLGAAAPAHAELVPDDVITT